MKPKDNKTKPKLTKIKVTFEFDEQNYDHLSSIATAWGYSDARSYLIAQVKNKCGCSGSLRFEVK